MSDPSGTGNHDTTSGGDPSFGFGGQWGYSFDAQDGLHLLTHRFYDRSTGRFLTRDPIGYDGGINLYAYTANNPVNCTDSTGFIIKRCTINNAVHQHSWLECDPHPSNPKHPGKNCLGFYPTATNYFGMMCCRGTWSHDDGNNLDNDPDTRCETLHLTPKQEACICNRINHPPPAPPYCLVGNNCYDETKATLETCGYHTF